jgi:hypothetical protein
LVNSLLTNWRVSPAELKKAQAILQAGGWQALDLGKAFCKSDDSWAIIAPKSQ